MSDPLLSAERFLNRFERVGRRVERVDNFLTHYEGRREIRDNRIDTQNFRSREQVERAEDRYYDYTNRRNGGHTTDRNGRPVDSEQTVQRLGVSRGGNDGRGGQGNREPDASVSATQEFVHAMEDAARAGPGAARTAALREARAILDDPQNGLKDRDGSIHFPTMVVRNSDRTTVHFERLGRRDYRDYPDAEAAMAQLADTQSKYKIGNITAAELAAASAATRPTGRTNGNGSDVGSDRDDGAPTIPAGSTTSAAARTGAGAGSSTVDASGAQSDVAPTDGEEPAAPGAGASAAAKPVTAKPKTSDVALAKSYDGVPQMKMTKQQVTEIQSALMHTKGFEEEAKAMAARGGADGKPGKATYPALTKLGRLMTPPMKAEDIDMSNPEIEAKVKTTILKQGQAASTRPGLTLPEGIREQAALEERGEVAPPVASVAPRVDQAQVAAAADEPDIVVTASRAQVAAAADPAKLAAAVAALKSMDANKDGIVQKAELPQIEMLNPDGTRMVGEAVTQNGIRRSDLGGAFAELAQSPKVSAQTVATVVATAEKSGLKVEGGAASLNPLFANVSFGSAAQFASTPAPEAPAAQLSQGGQTPPAQPLDQNSIGGPPAGLPNAGASRQTVRQ